MVFHRHVDSDKTVTDIVTGLMWSKEVSQTKVSLAEARRVAKKMTLGGHNNWRVQNIKELGTGSLKYAEEMEYSGYNAWRLPNAKELQYIFALGWARHGPDARKSHGCPW